MKSLSTALAALLLLAHPAAAAPSLANGPVAPGVTTQIAGAYRFLVGEARVSALSDGTVPIDLHQLLRGASPARIDALLAQSFQANPAEASINAYLIELGDRRVLVDVGAGDLFGPGNGGKLPMALATTGVTPEQITDILITHVHSDHSGGLVRNGRMLFPNATVHAGAADVTFFLDPRNAARTGYDQRYFEEADKTLRPYIEAGRVKAFDRDGEILPGVTAQLHPGHTPGSAFYTLTSQGQSIVFVGDMVHAAAVQFPEPAVTITFDQNQARAYAVRGQAFQRFAASGALIAAPHIAFPGVGHIRKEAKGYRWFPVAFGDRRPDATPPDLRAKPTIPAR